MADTTNREVAVRLLQSIQAGQPDLDCLNPDALWWVLGGPEIAVRNVIDAMANIFAPGGRLEVSGVTAQGDRVAVEAQSFQKTKDGRDYSNTYHFLVEFRDGQVARIKEYCDTAYADAFFAGES